MSVLNYTCTKRFLFQGMLLIHMSQSKSSTMHVVFRVTACKVYIYPYHAGRNGEESIPMLMMNHTDKDEPPGPPGPGGLPPRNRPTPIDGKNSPRLVEITSNPGTPLKVTEIPGQYSCLEPITLTFNALSISYVSIDVLEMVLLSHPFRKQINYQIKQMNVCLDICSHVAPVQHNICINCTLSKLLFRGLLARPFVSSFENKSLSSAQPLMLG